MVSFAFAFICALCLFAVLFASRNLRAFVAEGRICDNEIRTRRDGGIEVSG